ncbi:hypothetical protein HPB52_019021 [Rhipicephalus sanguineus]|uniref:Uncharacterized protein n=1 Tax=Rhipicephalus sanguineus TaxID=34632 RepID=A0A9D4PX83_RHISA|nr:hypothetical protein HPB52_019021 [Rhipicephalus sanguineus]
MQREPSPGEIGLPCCACGPAVCGPLPADMRRVSAPPQPAAAAAILRPSSTSSVPVLAWHRNARGSLTAYRSQGLPASTRTPALPVASPPASTPEPGGVPGRDGNSRLQMSWELAAPALAAVFPAAPATAKETQ